MTIKVLDSGFASTIQDLGRPGYYHLGIPIGGAMDRYSMRIGNMLVGNDESTAVVETVFTGPVLEFRQNSVVAVTGGELPPKLDGRVMPTWTSFEVREGQILSFDYLKHGARSYIAIHGGFSTPVSLGSRSTYAIGALGGIDGRGLKEGDVLPVGFGESQRKLEKQSQFPCGEFLKHQWNFGFFPDSICTESPKIPQKGFLVVHGGLHRRRIEWGTGFRVVTR